MRIGIYLTTSKGQGGVYQYSLSILDALKEIPENEYIVISEFEDIPRVFYKQKNFRIFFVKEIVQTLSFFNYIYKGILLIDQYLLGIIFRFNILIPERIIDVLLRLSFWQIIKKINKEKVDLIFFPTSSDLSLVINKPAIITIHDLQHRLNPQFKEVSANGKWESREYSFNRISKKSYKILVDSDIGKEDMINCYSISSSKIVVLPYLPPKYLTVDIDAKQIKSIRHKLSLPEKYIFYPAKFWPHKNHLNLIKALSVLKKRGLVANLILTGSQKAEFSTFSEVMKVKSDLGLSGQVKYLGYVSDMELSVIYKLSEALVMPTYFGPTNIPILEAWLIGTPVITSNIRGCRDQLGNAGLLVNPDSSPDIADKIQMVYGNNKLRSNLISKGKKRLSKWTFDNFKDKISLIINEYSRWNNYGK